MTSQVAQNVKSNEENAQSDDKVESKLVSIHICAMIQQYAIIYNHAIKIHLPMASISCALFFFVN